MASTFQPTVAFPTNGYSVGPGGRVHTIGAAWDRGTTALVINDVLAGPYVPAGARIVGVMLAANDCDSGALLTLDVGDTGDVDRLVAAATVGQAGGATTTLALAGCGYKYTAETQINVKVKAAPAGAGASDPQVITLMIQYIVE